MKGLDITVHEEESGREGRQVQHISLALALSWFSFSRSLAQAAIHSGAFRAVTPGPFLEMILVGDELWPVGWMFTLHVRGN